MRLAERPEAISSIKIEAALNIIYCFFLIDSTKVIKTMTNSYSRVDKSQVCFIRIAER